MFYDFNIKLEKELIINGDSAHHLNVVRVKNGEEILLLNGKGVALKAVVRSISKQQVDLQVLEQFSKEPTHHLSLAIASPKKDAFEDIVKMAVELGINSIYPLKSEYSQYDYVPNERLERIIESALIQSNNFFIPTIHPLQTLESFLEQANDKIYFFNSIVDPLNCEKQFFGQEEAGVLLIGPEAGFKIEEITLIRNSSKAHEIHLPTPILRAPTALCAGVGYLLAKS